MLEGPAEIVPAQADELRKRVERYLLHKMFLDVGGDDPFLPRGEAAPELGRDGGHPAVESDEFMRKHDAKRVEIEPIFRAGTVDQALQLESRVPQRCILEEQPRGKGYVREPQCQIELRGIEVEVRAATARERLVSFAIFVAGRHECELAREIAQIGSRRALHESLSAAPFALLVPHQQMHGCAKAILNIDLGRGFDGFGRHAVPGDSAATDEIGRRNLDHRMNRVGGSTTV